MVKAQLHILVPIGLDNIVQVDLERTIETRALRSEAVPQALEVTMRLDRLRVQNFRNFCDVNVPVFGDIVLLGENRVGKSNLLHAVRLVLDPSLSDSARRLKLSDFWDGCDLSESPQIEVHVDFADFSKNDGETALLTDYRSASNPEIATLSYVYRKKLDVEETIQSPDDCEFIVYGGENQDNGLCKVKSGNSHMADGQSSSLSHLT